MNIFELKISRQSVRGLSLGAAALLWAGSSLYADTIDGYQRMDFSLTGDTSSLILVDADNDGLSDILAIAENSVHLYFQSAGVEQTRFDFSEPQASLEMPGQSVGWDVSGKFSLIALIDGNRVMRWQLQDRQFTDAETVLDGVSGFLPPGMHRLTFARDINNDGREDLIIPAAGELGLYIQSSDGSFQPPLLVSSDIRLRSVLQSDLTLDRDVGQSLNIPLMSLRDVNGDDQPDLISDTSERLDVFFAAPQANAYFPQEPDISIDRVAIRERLGEFDIDQLDFANLTGVLALTHEEILQDMNGDGVDDLILREGGRVALHLGSPLGMDLAQADQILRSSGNVLSVFMHDENEDGRPDLWLWRVDQVSLGDVFLWLAISGTINLEAYIYPSEGDNFARRPSRRITVALRFPSVVRMIGSVNEVRERARSSEAVIPSAQAIVSAETLQGSSAEAGIRDLLALVDGQLQLFYRAVATEPAPDEDRFLASLNYRRQVDNYEIDIRRVIDEFDVEINSDVRAVSDRQPDAALPLPMATPRSDIAMQDLNNDGLDDIFVLLKRDETAVTGILFLSD